MTRTQQLEIALAAADAPIWLDSAAQVARAAKAWRRSPALGVDTEFVRERTYFANLGLVQVSDGHSVWLLDPLVDGAIEPLAELLADPDLVKIFHSPSEDLEVLQHVTGQVPDPLFDTQLALAMLGEPLQLGYHLAVEKQFGVAVDKGLTRSNWLARPLRPELLRYAALDVCVLPMMRTELLERLQELGRDGWLAEDCQRLVNAARQPVVPADSWQRIRGIERLDGASLAVLKPLAAWREKEARRKNRPRGFIVTDPLLLALARRKPLQPADLEALTDWHPRARQRYAEAVTSLVAQAVESGKTLPEVPQLSSAQQSLLKKLRAQIGDIAETLSVDPALLATRKELEQVVLAGPGKALPERLRGWRGEVVGEPLRKILTP
jgi:ribonuclease D